MKGRVVGYCIVKDETITTLTDVFQDFISHNDINVKTVVVDKDAAEKAAIKEVFPEGIDVSEGKAFECEEDDPNRSHTENNHNMACGDGEGDMANDEKEGRMGPCDDVVNAVNKFIHEEADFDQLDLHYNE
ncbi:hypothetical protein PoB_000659100 [Plakobranchus ocellatus]|uniref:ZSWIM1/3 RNaseH-like domain-containing protein n=1 Tax=Plakobranchus ocellatus TaxID=259542 RepID=A0AAV3YA38_9GAST|nr:hypothetical protein PoB_000659100 [Plakobranchus ocellatus]